MAFWVAVVLLFSFTYVCIFMYSLGLEFQESSGEEQPRSMFRGHTRRRGMQTNHSVWADRVPVVPVEPQSGAARDAGSATKDMGQDVLSEGATGGAKEGMKSSIEQKQPGFSRSKEEKRDGAAMAGVEEVVTTRLPKSRTFYEKHAGKSCQGYVEEPPAVMGLDVAKDACLASDKCQSIECPSGASTACTMRKSDGPVNYAPADCYLKVDPEDVAAKIHPAYDGLLKEYPFQQVTTQDGKRVNIILVRTPWGANGDARKERALYDKYKNDILFLGISSFEDYPLDAMNPYSPRLDVNYFLGAFPGFLHMMHQPEKYFAAHVKTLLMSQSDFQLPAVSPATLHVPKKYDFTYAATWPLGQSPTDAECMGWSGYAKNWTFVKQALHVMCKDYNLQGVLIATKGTGANERCAIPDSCEGKVTQTTYVAQATYFNFLKQSRFAFVPQLHDASPRVTTQALVHDVPVLMNAHISGGWKYINENTGEFFHDLSDFRQSLEKILQGAATPSKYQPRKWVLENYGNEHSGKRLLAFVKENFPDRVLPKNTRLLLT